MARDRDGEKLERPMSSSGLWWADDDDDDDVSYKELIIEVIFFPIF
jgi:hypothetical protein